MPLERMRLKMKQKSTKIIIVLIAIILIAGIVMTFTKGLKFNLNYANSKKIEINIGKEFEEKDIKEITNEVFEKQPVLIQAIEVYKDAVSITTTDITEEQKNNLITKINEKYDKEISADDVTIEENANIRGRDIIKPYIIPSAITTVIVLAYLAIRYYKINSLKVTAKSFITIVVAQLLLLSIIAITRMPIGLWTMPTVLAIFIISIYMITTKFDKDLEEKTKEDN